MRSRISLVLAVGSAVLLAAIAPVQASFAAASTRQGNAIAGSVYEGGGWYESSVTRHVTTANDTISLDLSEVPSAGGIDWYVVNAATGKKLGGTLYYDLSEVGDYLNIVSHIPSGTTFHNVYAQGSNCNFRCGKYEFSGYEYY